MSMYIRHIAFPIKYMNICGFLTCSEESSNQYPMDIKVQTDKNFINQKFLD